MTPSLLFLDEIPGLDARSWSTGEWITYAALALAAKGIRARTAPQPPPPTPWRTTWCAPRRCPSCGRTFLALRFAAPDAWCLACSTRGPLFTPKEPTP